MPWTPDDAERHTKKADTEARKKLWAKVANQSLAHGEAHAYKDPEGHAIRVANAVIDRTHK